MLRYGNLTAGCFFIFSTAERITIDGLLCLFAVKYIRINGKSLRFLAVKNITFRCLLRFTASYRIPFNGSAFVANGNRMGM